MTRKVLCRFMHMIAGCLLLQPNNACYSKQKTKKKTLRIHVTRSKGALIFLFVFFAFFFFVFVFCSFLDLVNMTNNIDLISLQSVPLEITFFWLSLVHILIEILSPLKTN